MGWVGKAGVVEPRKGRLLMLHGGRCGARGSLGWPRAAGFGVGGWVGDASVAGHKRVWWVRGRAGARR